MVTVKGLKLWYDTDTFYIDLRPMYPREIRLQRWRTFRNKVLFLQKFTSRVLRYLYMKLRLYRLLKVEGRVNISWLSPRDQVLSITILQTSVYTRVTIARGSDYSLRTTPETLTLPLVPRPSAVDTCVRDCRVTLGSTTLIPLWPDSVSPLLPPPFSPFVHETR